MMESIDYEPYNVRDVEEMPYRHWWFKAHNHVTRKVWDILIVACETEEYHWRCSCAGRMSSGSASRLEEAKLAAVEFARSQESSF